MAVYRALSESANAPQIAEMSTLRLGIQQLAPALGDAPTNAQKIAHAASQASCDLFLTPELSLTGYDLRDDVHVIAGDTSWLDLFADCPPVLAGFIDRDAAGVPYNVAALIEHGALRFEQRKVHLPTYGMFDEARYFGKGTHVEPFQLNDWRIGVLICEDLWHPMLAYLHALQAADVLLVMAASPGRGVIEGGEDDGFFASSDAWVRIARAYALLYGVYVVVCNRTGVEGGITFGGESFVVAPDASIIAKAGIDEELLRVDLHRDTVLNARRPYAHIRDESVAVALQQLQRIASAQ